MGSYGRNRLLYRIKGKSHGCVLIFSASEEALEIAGKGRERKNFDRESQLFFINLRRRAFIAAYNSLVFVSQPFLAAVGYVIRGLNKALHKINGG